MNVTEVVLGANEDISHDIVIDANTPPHVIAGHLTARGCENLTSKLNSLSITSRPIASGGFGDVYQGELLDGTRVAIKTLRLPATYDPEESVGKLLKRAARELYVWSKCQHVNVLPLLGLAEFNSQLRMVSLWIDNGNLPSYIARYSDLDRHALSIHVCEGLVYLHSIGIVHGDLKGSNVLVSVEGIPMINDFGNAVHHGTLMIADTTQKNWNTPQWTAPEVMDERQTGNTQEADVYSLGMTILETITGKNPYHEKKSIHAIYLAKAVTKEVPAQPEKYIPSSTRYGRSLWSLLKHCWAYEPKERPNTSEVVTEMRRLGPNTQTKLIGQGCTVHLSETHMPNIGAKHSLEECSPTSISKRPKHDSPRPALRPSLSQLGIPVPTFLAHPTPSQPQNMGIPQDVAQTLQPHVPAMPQYVVSPPKQPQNHGTPQRVTGTSQLIHAIPRRASPQNTNTTVQQNPNIRGQSGSNTNMSQNPNVGATPSASQAPNPPTRNPNGQQTWKGQIVYLLRQRDHQSPAQLHFHAIAVGGPGHNIETDRWPPRLVNTTGFKALPRPTAAELYASPLPFGQIIIDPVHSAPDQQKHAVFHKVITAGYSIFYEFSHNPMNPLPPNAQPGSARGLLFFSTPTVPAQILFKVFLEQPCPPVLCRGGQPAGPGLMGNNTNGATVANGANDSGTRPTAVPGAGPALPGGGAGVGAPAMSAGAGGGGGNGLPGGGASAGLHGAGAGLGGLPNGGNMFGAQYSNPVPGAGLQGMVPGAGMIAGVGARPNSTPTPPSVNPAPNPTMGTSPAMMQNLNAGGIPGLGSAAVSGLGVGGVAGLAGAGLNPGNASGLVQENMSGLNPGNVPGMGTANVAGLNPVAMGVARQPHRQQQITALHDMALAKLGLTPAQYASAPPQQQQQITQRVQQLMLQVAQQRQQQQQAAAAVANGMGVAGMGARPGIAPGQPGFEQLQAFMRQQQQQRQGGQ